MKNWSPSPQQAATELLRRRRARRSLIDYAKYIEVPGAPVNEQDDESESFNAVETTLAKHHEIILDATQRCIAKHRGRTMLFLPPGSAKSTYATVVSTTWAMGVNPNFRAIHPYVLMEGKADACAFMVEFVAVVSLNRRP